MKNLFCEKCGRDGLDVAVSLLSQFYIGQKNRCKHEWTTKIKVYPDGNKMCAVFSDFVNLQESPAGFGRTAKDAIKALKANARHGACDKQTEE